MLLLLLCPWREVIVAFHSMSSSMCVCACCTCDCERRSGEHQQQLWFPRLLPNCHPLSHLLTFVHIHRRPLMPPTLPELIDLFITNRFRGGGQGVLLRRLGEKAPERVYCCLFSQQGQPGALKLLQTPFLFYLITSVGCLWRASAWRVPARGPHYSFNI